MPIPRRGESRGSYMGRCVPMVKGEGKDSRAAVGKCEGMYDSEKPTANKRKPDPLKMDPTRTSDIVQRMIRDLDKRFIALKRAVVDLLLKDGLVSNILRKDMPQIRKEHWDEFLRYSKSRTMVTRENDIDPYTLQMIQTQWSQERVDAIPLEKLKYPILISKDGFVLDGNHRWLKAKQEHVSIPVLRVGLMREEALELLREFPKAEFVSNASYRFHTDLQRLHAFHQWLAKQIAKGLLPLYDPATGDPWTSMYTAEAYKRAHSQAFDAVRKPALARKMDFYNGSKAEFLRSAFGKPVSIEKVKLLASRTYNDLKGVTDAMSTNMSRVLANGMLQGSSPRKIAREMVDTVDNLGRVRARTIARTEIIHAHAEGSLDAYEQLGVEEVGVRVEWAATDDDKTCPLCEDLEGKTFTIKGARGRIPRHPNCRCSWIPSV